MFFTFDLICVFYYKIMNETLYTASHTYTYNDRLANTPSKSYKFYYTYD